VLLKVTVMGVLVVPRNFAEIQLVGARFTAAVIRCRLMPLLGLHWHYRSLTGWHRAGIGRLEDYVDTATVLRPGWSRIVSSGCNHPQSRYCDIQSGRPVLLKVTVWAHWSCYQLARM